MKFFYVLPLLAPKITFACGGTYGEIGSIAIVTVLIASAASVVLFSVLRFLPRNKSLSHKEVFQKIYKWVIVLTVITGIVLSYQVFSAREFVDVNGMVWHKAC